MTTTPDVDAPPLTDDEVAAALAEPAADTTAEPAPDPAAPYGYTANGRPRKRPAPAAGLGRTAPAPRRRSGGRRPSSSKPKTTTIGSTAPVDRRAGAASLIATIGLGLGIAGKVTGQDAYALDAMAVQLHAEPLTDGMVATAEAVPAVAAVLDWFARSSPFAELGQAVMILASQVAVNHGMMPAGAMGLPTLGPDQLAAHFGSLAGVNVAAPAPAPAEG